MDIPFSIDAWKPTHASTQRESALGREDIVSLSHQLAEATSAISESPYQPDGWLSRAEILRRLRYPELAMGDAYKADLLCRQHLDRIFDGRQAGWRLGKHMGFWMLDPDCADGDDVLAQLLAQLGAVQLKAQKLARRCCDDASVDPFTEGEGSYHPQPYPWLDPEQTTRSDALVDQMNHELASTGALAACGQPYCQIQRDAFRTGNRDALGIFATTNIPKDTTILIDRTKIWGCNGPGTGGVCPEGEAMCYDPIHPNLPDETADQDLRWVRDNTGTGSSSALLTIRLLLAAIQGGNGIVQHPLDHYFTARLTPTYQVRSVPQTFYAMGDIVVPIRALQQFGVDVFADLRFDTWVVFTVTHRQMNNTCGDPARASLMPLFSLFNHSCNPNVEWSQYWMVEGKEELLTNRESSEYDVDDEMTIQDHTRVIVRTVRDVKEGEQLLVEYDNFAHGKPVAVRRATLRRWLVADCVCERCVREAGEELEAEKEGEGSNCKGEGTSKGGHEAWDTSEEVKFPEDELNFGKAKSR